MDLRASPTDSLRFSSHVESSPHIESHFCNYTSTNSLFFLFFYSFILTFFSLSPFLFSSLFLPSNDPQATLCLPPQSTRSTPLIQNQQKSPPIWHFSSKMNSKSNNSENSSPKPINPLQSTSKTNKKSSKIQPNHETQIKLYPRLRSALHPGRDQHSTPGQDRHST